MLREVVSSDKGPHMGLQCIEVWIVKRLYCGVFHRSVHSFGLPIGPWMIWLGQFVLYAMLTADPIKDVPNETVGWAIPVSCLLCEGDTVVCEDGMNGVWVDRHNFLKKCSSILLGRRVKERHVGKFGDTINGQKHVLLAFLQT